MFMPPGNLMCIEEYKLSDFISAFTKHQKVTKRLGRGKPRREWLEAPKDIFV